MLKLWGGRGLYLHHFVGDDWSRDLHDHPKRFVSIGLCGAYVEQAAVGWGPGMHYGHLAPLAERTYRAPWVRTFPAKHIHRLRLIAGRPCWTLVFVCRSTRPWGFWTRHGFVPWRTYVHSDEAHERRACP